MPVFSCIPATYESKKEAGMASIYPRLPTAFPSAPSYSQHQCLNSVCSRTNFSGAGELEALSEQAPPERDGVLVLGGRPNTASVRVCMNWMQMMLLPGEEGFQHSDWLWLEELSIRNTSPGPRPSVTPSPLLPSEGREC
uniref:Uncharacterized protein n=1 Tax=Pipistrellus kuhlii TaxID=59472 RepID=A0A7J7YA75_PIPKU|nr:hypothetical protein mPipKuh1_010358 [Pipistrellus kuhlii]